MKKTTIYYLLSFMMAFMMMSCKVQKADQLLYSNYSTRAIASENGGSYVLRVQGKGTSRAMATENALKQAARDVIFTDVHTAYGDHKPLMRLITDPTTERKNEAFFNNFFSNNGGYQNFVRGEKKDQEYYSEDSKNTVIMNVVVDRAALKEYLKSQGF